MTQRTGGGVTITIASQNWNYENKPTQIQKGSTTVSLTYDGNRKRVKKVSSVSGTTLYYGELYEIRAGVGMIHLFAGRNRVASVLSDGRTQFYHTDHLGSASVITDSNGNRKEQIVYFPFGSYRAVGNTNGTYDFDTSFPDVFYTFTGQEDDDDLGFYNYGARLYDPLIGRFISPDSMVPNPEDPQSFNRYAYALNNPLRYTDPTGNFSFDGFDSEFDSLYGFYENPFNLGSNLGFYGSGSQWGDLNSGRYNLNTPSISFSTTTYALNIPQLDFGNSNFRFNDFSSGSNGGAYGHSGTIGATHVILSGVEYANEFFTGYAQQLQDIGKFAYYGKNGAVTYKLGFYGNQYIDSTLVSAAKASQAKFAAVGSVVSKGSTLFSLGVTTVGLVQEGPSWRSSVHAGVSYGMAFAAYFGGPWGVSASLIYSYLDATGRLDPLWNMIDDTKW